MESFESLEIDDICKEIGAFYRRLNTDGDLDFSPDEMLVSTLREADAHLSPDNVDKFCQFVISSIEGIAYERAKDGSAPAFPWRLEDELFDLLCRLALVIRKPKTG